MSAVAISLADFADEFAAKTNALDVPFLHPAADRAVYWWLNEMRWAAEAERADEVAELAQRVTEKVLLEREWYPEGTCTNA